MAQALVSRRAQSLPLGALPQTTHDKLVHAWTGLIHVNVNRSSFSPQSLDFLARCDTAMRALIDENTTLINESNQRQQVIEGFEEERSRLLESSQELQTSKQQADDNAERYEQQMKQWKGKYERVSETYDHELKANDNLKSLQELLSKRVEELEAEVISVQSEKDNTISGWQSESSRLQEELREAKETGNSRSASIQDYIKQADGHAAAKQAWQKEREGLEKQLVDEKLHADEQSTNLQRSRSENVSLRHTVDSLTEEHSKATREASDLRKKVEDRSSEKWVRRDSHDRLVKTKNEQEIRQSKKINNQANELTIKEQLIARYKADKTIAETAEKSERYKARQAAAAAKKDLDAMNGELKWRSQKLEQTTKDLVETRKQFAKQQDDSEQVESELERAKSNLGAIEKQMAEEKDGKVQVEAELKETREELQATTLRLAYFELEFEGHLRSVDQYAGDLRRNFENAPRTLPVKEIVTPNERVTLATIQDTRFPSSSFGRTSPLHAHLPSPISSHERSSISSITSDGLKDNRPDTSILNDPIKNIISPETASPVSEVFSERLPSAEIPTKLAPQMKRRAASDAGDSAPPAAKRSRLHWGGRRPKSARLAAEHVDAEKKAEETTL